jgi:hypothetical protein
MIGSHAVSGLRIPALQILFTEQVHVEARGDVNPEE